MTGSRDEHERIVACLAPFVSEQRKDRIERVLHGRSRSVAMVLEDIYDKHNASAILRTAEALGMFEIHLVESTLPFRANRKVASGTHKWMDVVRSAEAHAAAENLRARGYQIWASHLHADAIPVSEIPVDAPVALVFGNEHAGVSEAMMKHATGVFWIPMAGFVESLNVSVAAALAAYDVMTRKRNAGVLTPLADDEILEKKALWYAQSVRGSEPLLRRFGVYRKE